MRKIENSSLVRDLGEYLSHSLGGVVALAEGVVVPTMEGGGDSSHDLEALSERWVWRRESKER